MIPGRQCKTLNRIIMSTILSGAAYICKVKAKFEISLTLLFTNFIYQKSSSGAKIRLKD